MAVLGYLRGKSSGGMPLRARLLLRMRRKLARPGQMQPTEEMDQEMRRRLGNLELDSGEHQGVPEMQRDDRERRRLQSHGLQESELQSGLLLGLSGSVGAARQLLVQLQPLRRRGGESGEECPGEVALGPSKVSILLQQVHESHAIPQVRA